MTGRLFTKSAISDNSICRDVGRSPERPFIIKSALVETSLGDLISKMICLASIAKQFDHAELHVRYRDVRPYSGEVVSLLEEVSTSRGIKFDIPRWLRLGLPDARLWFPLARGLNGRRGSWGAFCDFFASDWMLNPRWLHAIEDPARLQIPHDQADRLERELIENGADPDRWFAVVHYRASTYLRKRSGQLRNGDPAAQQEMINYIIHELGGQVVLLGHPELEALPPQDGFIDLSRIKDSFMLQAYACSRARFMIAGPSGPIIMGWGFQIPTGLVDASDAVGGWGRCEHVILTHEVTTPEGATMRNKTLFDSGLLDYPVLRDKIRAGEDYVVRKNSGPELAAVARHLYEVSTDTVGWRIEQPEQSQQRPNQFVWPPQTSENLNFIDV
ncbi:MAG: TIGR04372 family glycosyltransferase [Alphaproteobacteria bacterium]|nr:TIGR04372 family glycosyltransferase [Alphaproteobacteria bacterium]